VLDLWLMVVMYAYAVEIFLISFPVPMRYTVGWYSGRICGIVSSSLVLLVLLYEITTLYARLLRAVFAQRREREVRLMTGGAVAATIAHEVAQPLSGMINSANAGLRWLDRPAPDLDETRAALKQVVAAGHRAGEVIHSVRAIFKKDAPKYSSIDVNELIGDVLALVRADLQRHRVSVESTPKERLPRISGDRVQLQQVLVNLIINAIDSMAGRDGPSILRLRSESPDGASVLVSVEDTGMGIASPDVDRIFNPLFTTKSDGMGMGLSICRSIIEAHDGQLRIASSSPNGTVFQFVLRADGRDRPESRGATGHGSAQIAG
jgi:signal transduction histidine kinase